MKQIEYKPHSGVNFLADELLPCPFCGGEAVLTFMGNDYAKSRKVEVKCPNCRAKIINAGIRIKSKELAIYSINAWNKRVFNQPKLDKMKTENKDILNAYGQSHKMMQEAKIYQDKINALKEGDVIEISGFYFDWVVKNGYSELLKKECVYATAQGGLMHSSLDNVRILRINGIKI